MNKSILRLASSCVGLSLASSLASAFAQSFTPIVIPPVPYYLANPVASVFDISPDGTRVGGAILQHGVAVDCSGVRCTTPFVWSRSGGMDIESVSGNVHLFDTQYGPISTFADGIVGITKDFSVGQGWRDEPILFTPTGGIPLRDASTATTLLEVAGLSDDASAVVGAIVDPGEYSRQAMRWTQSTGVVPIGIGNLKSAATAISGDGKVIVGRAGALSPYAGDRAFRWTENGGATFLASLIPNGPNVPTGVSNDGSVIVGSALGLNGYLAYRWTSDMDTVALDLPGGYTQSAAADVTADGRVVVGQLIVSDQSLIGGFYGGSDPPIDYWNAAPALTAANSKAMIWDATHGTRLLQDVLADDNGLANQLKGWTLVSASAISGDGNVIAGVGVNPLGNFQGWVATIPEPSTVALSGASFFALALASAVRTRGRAVIN
jgi:uncharacterized membrane protein